MTQTIDKAKINEYRDSVIHLSQQQDNRVRPHVTEVASSGEFHNWDTLAPTDAIERTKATRRQDTPYIDETFARRISTPRVFEHNLTFEDYDKAEMAIDPGSAFATNQGYSMARAYDDVIIDAATGTALDGDGATNALPAGQIIGDGTGLISFDYLTQIQGKFMEDEIMIDMPKVALVGPNMITKLMQLTENTSADYVNREALQKLTATGICANWMGFTWVLSNRLTVPSAGQLDCLFMTKAAIGLQVNMNMKVRVGEDPSKSYHWQVFSQFSAGAVRVEDEHLVVGRFKDALV